MRIDSYAQTSTSRGVAHKALSVLMALVLALGLTPISRGQAWATESLSVELAAGSHQGSGKTSWTMESTTNSGVTLYAQIQNMKMGSTNVVSDGFDAYSNRTMSDFSDFAVTWYKDSVAEANTVQTDSMKVNSLDSTKPAYTTDYSYSTGDFSNAGAYKFYAVATWSHDGYTSATSEPLEFTVIVGNGGSSTDTKYALTGVTDATAGTIAFVDSWGAALDADEAVAGDDVYVKVSTADKETYPISGITVSDGTTATDVTDDEFGTDYETYSGKVKYYKFTMPAQVVTVTANFGGGTPSVQTVNVNFEVRSADNTLLFEDDDYTVAVKDSTGADAPSSYDQNKCVTVFTLAVGETYTYTLTPAYGKENTYATTTGSFTVAEDQGTVMSVTMKAAGSEPADAPVLTLNVTPAEGADSVEVYAGGDDDPLVFVDGKASIAAGTQYIEAFVNDEDGYTPVSATLGSKNLELADSSFWFDMPEEDVTLSIVLTKDGDDPEPKAHKVKADPDMKNGKITKFTIGGYWTTGDEAEAGQKVYIYAEPDSGFSVDEITAKDADGNIVEVTDAYTPYFTMVDSDVTVYVSFKELKYNVSLSKDFDTSHGSISLDKSTFVPGDTIRVSISPEQGYRLAELSFSDPDGETISSGNWWDPLSVQIAADGLSADVKISDGWYQDEDGYDGQNTDLIIDGSFELIPPSYSVSVKEGIEHGSLSLENFGASVEEGDTAHVEVIPDAGYTVGSVTVEKLVDGEWVTDEGTSPYASGSGVPVTYNFEMPAYDVRVNATFVKATYKVNIYSWNVDSSKGSVMSSFADGQVGNMDDTCVLTVEPKSGYVLADISVEAVNAKAGNPALTKIDDSTYTFAMPMSDVNVKATFLQEQKIEASDAEKTYGDEPFALSATCSNEGAVLEYASSDESVATIDESGTVTIMGAGEAVITVTAPESSTYAAASKSISVKIAEKASELSVIAAGTGVVTVPYSAGEAGYSIARADAITVTGNTVDADGNSNLTFLKKFGDRSIVIDSETGEITVPSTIKVGVYPVRVVVMDSGTQNVAAALKTVSFSIEIEPMDLTGKTIEFEKTTTVFNGNAQTPIVKSIGGIEVSEGDYAAVYKRNGLVTSDLASVGNITVSVTGKGNCKGTSASAVYTIVKADVANAEVVLSAEKFTYNGKVQAPEVQSVKVGDYTLAAGEYSAKFSNAQSTAAETYSITLTGEGSNVTGTKTVEYTIVPQSIANKTVALKATTLIYNKTVQEPVVTTVGGQTLKKGIDYTMSYKKGKTAVTAANVKEVGTYTLTVNGAGNYTGSAKAVTFKILNKSTLAAKAANPTVALAKVSKAAQSAVVGSVSNVGKGTLTVKNVSADATAKKWKVAYNAKTKKITVTVPKKTKKNAKGYAVKVQVSAAGNTTYAPGNVTLTSKVIVK